ncbi:SDR family oxidoreductase [Pseudomaricurvus alcaniphilus]|uniref:SDR family oxidoreductase n=1 Tax=Pseudomaricurvus alcaniphilus TaxID=1166482 RepID=UPI00140B51B6|nr:SDR family oxidoreductase [Pseudomaricurvus alcaniphilus]NHN37881.1 SDR family oxidoreductase [Pseudomaricurvus alcaniphilus]
MNKTAVITGANRGIGLELVKHYLKLGWQVYGICREASEALKSSGATVVAGIDVAAAACTSRLQTALQKVKIDLLINNAGILRDERLGELNFATIEEQFQVNTLGPLRVTEALLDNMVQGTKVALVTSRMGSIADNTSGGRYGYRMSKAALNIAGVSLAHDLKGQGVAVAILHPGYVATDMVGGRGDITPEVAASRLAARIEGLTLENSGTFWHSNGEVLPW